ncbi:UDP-N-acetylmuramate--L-alanine ligase [Candidatus Uhrbacteria bacterium]|nr:UDP-N-acetylmuramate--L-alanine ligase [Candidatus Uhrbacteria bacterium]
MFDHVHHVHLVGAGGVGVSAVGKLFLGWGCKVTGSDLHGGLFVDDLVEAGAIIHLDHKAENIPNDCNLIVYSSAVPETNPERLTAKARGIRQLTLAQFLGELAKGYFTIAVTGTHGKSTTTAMVGKVLEAAGLDPTVIVGSRVPGWDGNIRLGGNRPGAAPGQPPQLVIEACEHLANHLLIHPKIGVITNVEMDHPDFYRNVGHVQETMEQFAKQSEKSIWVEKEPELDIHLRIPGPYNQRNAAGAMAVARTLSVDEGVARKALEEFPGIWRRFEHVGTWNGADVYSDYGHHPTAIKVALAAAREAFPRRRLVHIFQPHQHARTRELFSDFVAALGTAADLTIVPEIYGVAGRTEDTHVSSRDIVEAVKKNHPDVAIFYTESLEATNRMVRELAKPGDVLFFQGAGDIDEVARKFNQNSFSQELSS